MYRLGQYLLRSLQTGLAGSWITELGPEAIGRPAIVFSPHQDDETLGCGGTIIKKRAAGAGVKIVFMTDGRTSHAHLMPADRLVELRAQEALSAARVLGVASSEVCFLGFPDGRLGEHEASAVHMVMASLRACRPAEVFVPFRKDRTADHLATHRIVIRALMQLSMPVTVYEYPIWFWYHWPWVRFRPRRPEGKRVLRASLSAGFGSRLLGTFRHYVRIEDLLDRKRAALNEHASQMARLVPDPRWKVLSDVADGDFLKCFFQPWEVFHCYALRPHTSLSEPGA